VPKTSFKKRINFVHLEKYSCANCRAKMGYTWHMYHVLTTTDLDECKKDKNVSVLN
jgi:hypothetical protein